VGRESSQIRCAKCGCYIDVTQKPDVAVCPDCGAEYRKKMEPSGVPGWVYVVVSVGGGIVCARVDRENRWRGTAIGAIISGALLAVVDWLLRSSSDILYESVG
jgi:predicted RNA-binding Zn-ribbon protein involved in translation (DUF1610 family)